MNEETVGRIGSMFAGLFLFFFGLPFTLTPFMILSDGVIDPDYPLESLFMIAFTIPFLRGGLLVQFLGLSMIRGSNFLLPLGFWDIGEPSIYAIPVNRNLQVGNN